MADHTGAQHAGLNGTTIVIHGDSQITPIGRPGRRYGADTKVAQNFPVWLHDETLAAAGVEIIHRGRYKTMSKHERKLLKRRQAVEPAIGHLKADHRMNRCWLKGSMGDALHALSCALGYNLRWLRRAVVRLGLRGFLLALLLTRWMACLASRYVVHETQTAHAKMVQA